MNDPILTRQSVRTALTAARKEADGLRKPLTEVQLFEGVNRFTRDPLTVDELRAALLWNEGRGYAEQSHDDDRDCTVWRLTPKGAEKEGVK